MPLVELLDKAANRNTATFEVALLYNPAQKSVVNIMSGLVAVILTLTLTMIMFTSTTIVREQEHSNMEMLITTLHTPMALIIGKVVPYIFIGAIQVVIILEVGYCLFHVPVNGNLLQLVLNYLFIYLCQFSLGTYYFNYR